VLQRERDPAGLARRLQDLQALDRDLGSDAVARQNLPPDLSSFLTDIYFPKKFSGKSIFSSGQLL